VVNVKSHHLITDTYLFPSKYEHSWDVTKWLRKNRNVDPIKHCHFNNIGVDLNRNYGYEDNSKYAFKVGKLIGGTNSSEKYRPFFKFNNHYQGSSSDPCSETYKGPYPFSENETMAIKNAIDLLKGRVVSAMNFHNWGNLWIIPLIYSNERNQETLKSDFHHFYVMYEY